MNPQTSTDSATPDDSSVHPISATPDDSSTSSSGSSCGAVPKKPKGTRVVPSRYMQEYKKKKVIKGKPGNNTIRSGGKSSDNTVCGTPTRTSVAPQRFRAPTGPVPVSLDSTLLEKGDLQSTLLEGHKIAPPDLDISDIKDKTVRGKIPKAILKAEPITLQKKSAHESISTEQIIEMSESQLLDFTFLRLQIEKNTRRLEDETEQNVLLVCAERDKLQKKVHEQRCELLLRKSEQQLSELLESQAEIHVPSAAEAERFKSEYKAFATALDSTRHELPMKHIHVQESRQNYLDKLQKELKITESLVAELMPSFSEENAKAGTATRELEEVVLKINAYLPRALAHIIDLASQISKETSLKNQKLVEDTLGVESMKGWYFDKDFVI